MCHHHRHENLIPRHTSLHLLAQNDLVHKTKLLQQLIVGLLASVLLEKEPSNAGILIIHHKH
jgi:hypothetical protein